MSAHAREIATRVLPWLRLGEIPQFAKYTNLIRFAAGRIRFRFQRREPRSEGRTSAIVSCDMKQALTEGMSVLWRYPCACRRLTEIECFCRLFLRAALNRGGYVVYS